MSDDQVKVVLAKRVFFGHKSVGDDIIHGLRDLILADARLTLNLINSADPQLIRESAIVEYYIGENGNPQSKNDAFLAILDKGMGTQGGTAMFKYCYTDIDASTDVRRVFDAYRHLISTVKARYPKITIVHVTVPLTTVESTGKAYLKDMLGRPTRREANRRRNEFNDLLRNAYAGMDKIYDLAQIESTRADGSRSYFLDGHRVVYALAEEFTRDGGHLNNAGRLAAAKALLLLLARP